MAIEFSGAHLLGYSQANNFFGENIFRRSSTANMTISAYVDTRPSKAYPDAALPNADHLGVKEVFDYINSQVSEIGDWQEIKVDYGEGPKVVATGRVTSMESIRPNPVRLGEFTVDIEIPTSGSDDAWNAQGPTHQAEFKNEFAGTTVKNIFSESGAAIRDFSEQFSFNLNEDRAYEYEHSLSVSMYSGSHICPEPMSTAKDIAKKIFFPDPSDVLRLGFVDQQFSGFYAETNKGLGDVSNESGIKYFSETYDLENLNYSFSKKTRLDPNLKEDYSLTLNHSMTMGNDGNISVSEDGTIKCTLNKSIGSRFTIVSEAVETEIGSAYSRCNSFYSNYWQSGLVSPDYRWEETNVAGVPDNARGLFDRAVSVERNYEPSIAEAQYSVSFTNNTYTHLSSGVHEFTQNVSEDENGIVNVVCEGSFTPFNPNKFLGFTGIQVYNGIKQSLATKANNSYSYYKDKQNRDFKERSRGKLPVSEYGGELVDPSLALVGSSVTIPRYGKAVKYTRSYSDDPSLLKAGTPLYDLGFRKFKINTTDTMMKPINSEYVIAGKKYPIIHDAGQTSMGSRNFNIEAFIRRPESANTITSPSAWDLVPKLNAMKDEVSQIMANIIADAKLKGSSRTKFLGDVFIQSVNFSIDSKGNFKVGGEIPFIALGGEKHNTRGRII